MLANSNLMKIKEGVKPSTMAANTCLRPKRMQIRLSETGEYTDMYCPCGKCERCLQARRDELASRMFLHSIGYEFCYFVTLTYNSANLLPFKEHPYLADWLQTIPTYDSFNSTHKKAWTPSLLVQSHLTKFLKRLRSQLGFHISYAACGEYGEEFARPHFHVVLWSHYPITYDNVCHAWSYECKRTNNPLVVKKWRESATIKDADHGYFRFQIGRIDFNDLWANGSLNYDGKHCGNQEYTKDKKANHCFTYVAKYIGKNDPISWLGNAPIQLIDRIQFAYNVYTGNIDKLALMRPDPTYETCIYNHIQNSLSYDNKNFKQIDYMDFKKIVSPFFVSSRRPSLGKLYYLQNRERFMSQDMALPSFMGKKIAYPSYFYRLAAQDRYPIRLRKITDSGLSPSKDLLPRLYGFMQMLRESNSYWFALHDNYQTSSQIKNRRLFAYRLSDDKIQDYITHISSYTGTLDCIDFLDCENRTIHYIYDPYNEIFEGYVYNSSSREYEFQEYIERIDFCDMVLDYIEGEYKRYPDKLDSLQQKSLLYDCIMEDPDSENEIVKYLEIKDILHRKYKLTHKNEL